MSRRRTVGRFRKNWDRARTDEGFDVFHMAEFVAKPERAQALLRLGQRQKGARLREAGKHHKHSRTNGVRSCCSQKAVRSVRIPRIQRAIRQRSLHLGRKNRCLDRSRTGAQKSGITIPMQYVFDEGSLGQSQINDIWAQYEQIKSAEQKYGIVPNGVMFQDDKFFKPLQAADILAWQVQNHLRRTVLVGRDPDDLKLAHSGFKVLRQKRPMDLGFYSTDQIRRVFDKAHEYHKSTGRWPWDQGP